MTLKSKKVIFWAIVMMSMAAFILVSGLTIRHLTDPIVFRSHDSGECTKVIPKSAGSCDNLPEYYYPEIDK